MNTKVPHYIRLKAKEVNGTNEIQKLYQYAGLEPGKAWDALKAKPIEWVKIHNLPDHVYFNHSQHVMVGKSSIVKPAMVKSLKWMRLSNLPS